jgi:hypothetical protein
VRTYDGIEGLAVEEPEDVGLVERSFKPAAGEGRGEVEEGARRRRDRDAVEDGGLVGAQ